MRTDCSRDELADAALISTRLQPGVGGSGRGQTVSTVWPTGGKLLKQFPTARGADTRLKPGANERGDGEGDALGSYRGSSPSPRPSPSGREPTARQLPRFRPLNPLRGTAALKPPQSRRFAPHGDLAGSRQRLDCGGFSTAFEPAQAPSPLQGSWVGRDAFRRRPTGTPQQFERGLTFSLSQRERAGVRENASLARPCRTSATAVRRSPLQRLSEEDPKDLGKTKMEGLPSLSASNLWVPRRLPRATGTLLPSLSFHTHQPTTHRRTP